jgi:hypothetical protein
LVKPAHLASSSLAVVAVEWVRMGKPVDLVVLVAVPREAAMKLPPMPVLQAQVVEVVDQGLMTSARLALTTPREERVDLV